MFLNSILGGIKDLQIENKKRKNSSRAGRGTSSHRTESEVDSHDSSSISTLDQAVKQWMVAAAKGKFSNVKLTSTNTFVWFIAKASSVLNLNC